MDDGVTRRPRRTGSDRRSRDGYPTRMEDDQGHIGSNGLISREHWRPAEDEKLRNLVVQFGPKNWNTIAEHMDGRTGKSCRLRWCNNLDPNLNKLPFSAEEEARLVLAQETYGNKWAAIARLFPGRTDNAVKNQFHVIMGRKRKDPDNLPSSEHVGGHNIGIPSGCNGMLYEPAFPIYARNIMNLSPGAPFPFDLGTIYGTNLVTPMVPDGNAASIAAFGNLYASASASAGRSAFGNSDFRCGNAKDDKAENTADGNVSPPFIDFLGVGSKSQTDHET